MGKYDKVNIVTDQRSITGIGAYAIGLYEVFRNYREIGLFSTNYFRNFQLDFSERPNFLLFANNYAEVPFIKYVNNIRLKRSEYFKDKNLHLVGTDYYLTEVSDSVICTINDFYMRLIDRYLLSHPRDLLASAYINMNNIFSTMHFRKAKEIIVHSKYVSDVIKHKLGLKSSIIPIHVDYNFKQRDKTAVRELLNLPKNKKIILNVSGGGQNKNLNTLKKVIESLNEDYLLLKVNAPINSKRVINLGHVEKEKIGGYEMLFNAADIYLHTSINEGFGIPLIEAMASGLPIVAYRSPTSEEILGKAGLFADRPKDIDHFRSLIYNLDRDGNRVEISRELMSKVKKYRIDVIRPLWLSTYDRVFGG